MNHWMTSPYEWLLTMSIDNSSCLNRIQVSIHLRRLTFPPLASHDNNDTWGVAWGPYLIGLISHKLRRPLASPTPRSSETWPPYRRAPAREFLVHPLAQSQVCEWDCKRRRPTHVWHLHVSKKSRERLFWAPASWSPHSEAVAFGAAAAIPLGSCSFLATWRLACLLPNLGRCWKIPLASLLWSKPLPLVTP